MNERDVKRGKALGKAPSMADFHAATSEGATGPAIQRTFTEGELRLAIADIYGVSHGHSDAFTKGYRYALGRLSTRLEL